MDIQIILLTILLYLFINTLLSKEVLLWEPSKGKRILLVLIIWFVPFLGAVIAYKDLDLDWFKKKSQKPVGEQGIASGLLELGAIFNPGQKHVIEARKKEHVELSEDGQLYNNAPTDLNNIQKSQTSESSENTRTISLALLANMNSSELYLKREKAAKRKRFALQFVIVLFVVVVIVGFLSLQSNSIELVKHDHSCNQTECTYQVTVKNIDHFSHPVYLRINAFVENNRGYTTSTEIVASERIEFEISAGEEKIIDGKFAVPTKPKILNFSVGQIGESI
jgi:hypothetical protein